MAIKMKVLTDDIDLLIYPSDFLVKVINLNA